MKVFLVAFLAAAAVAQPQWLNPLYTTGYHGVLPTVVGSPLVYNTPSVVYKTPSVASVPYVKEDKMPEIQQEGEKVKVYKQEEVKPVVYSQVTPFGTIQQPIVPVQYKVEVPARYSVKNGEVEHHLYKREADADAYWPYTTYTNYAVSPYYQYYTGLPLTTYNYPKVVVAAPKAVAVPKVTYTKPVIESEAKTVANDAVTPFGYAEKGRYVADSHGALHVAKREAEADAGFVYSYPTAYTGYTYPTTYTGYTGLTYPATTYGVNPFVYHPPLAFTHPKVKTYANDAQKPENYAAKGQYRAENDGALHLAKRDADADAGLIYRYPTTYTAGLTYPTTYTSSLLHRTVPYSTFGYPAYYY